MRQRRAMLVMTAILASATVLLALLDRPVLAIVFGVSAAAQAVAAALVPRGRTVVTAVFTDIVDSTSRVAEIGDEAWGAQLRAHAATMRREFMSLPPLTIRDLGDGFLAVFPLPAPRPSQVIEAALRLSRAAGDSGVLTRTGIHAGECAVHGRDNVRGLAIHVASRVMDAALPGQVVISSAVRDLLGGTTLVCEPLGEHTLKGLPEPMRLYSVSEPRDEVTNRGR